MAPDAAGHFLDRFQPTPHGPPEPAVQEDPRPVVRRVLPQGLEAFLQQIRSHALEAVAQQVVEPGPLLGRQVLRPLQKAPAAVRQHRLVARPGQFLGLGRPHVVDGFVQAGDDVQPVADVQGR